MSTTRRMTSGRLSEPALETGKLIVEFLNSGYSNRRRGAVAGLASTHPHVSPQAIRAAIHLYQHGELTVGEMGRGLGISRGWASRVIEELEVAGYVERERQVDDRRVVKVRLRPAAIAEVERAYRGQAEAVDAALAPFDDAERALIQDFLRRLVDELHASAKVADTDADEDHPEPSGDTQATTRAAHLRRSAGHVSMSTDEIMALTRDET